VESGLACILYTDSVGERSARLKMVKRKGRDWRLESLNPAKPPIIMKAADLLACYHVVEVLPQARRVKKGTAKGGEV
jgi:SOS-response transcriptional repressor LexA